MENQTFTCQIPAQYFKAASYCMAVKDVRYYLNGILLDFPAGYIVSTDGHRLFIGRLPEDAPKDAPAVIVPDSLVKLALKALGTKLAGSSDISVTITQGEDENVTSVRLHTLAGTFEDYAIDGRFPEYQRIIPHKTSGEPAGFCFPYLSDATEALSWYSRGCAAKYKGTNINYNGNSGAVVWTPNSDDCLVVVMPMRVDVNGEFPHILKPRQIEAEREAA